MTHLRIDDLYDIALPQQPAVSPSGEVVFVLRRADRDADRDVTALWRAEGPLTSGPADRAPAWSPDGRTIAFLRAADGPAQIWLLPMRGDAVPEEAAERVTALPLGAGPPRWSPDGTAIAFTAPVSSGPIDLDAPIEIDRLDYQADGAGLLRSVTTQVHVLDLTTGEVTQVTTRHRHTGDPAWSPDGTRLAFPAALDDDTDLTGNLAAYVLDLETGADRVVLDGSAGPVTWTPDGRALLIVGRRDTRAGHAGLLLAPLDGGPVVDLAAGLDRNVMPGETGYPGARPQVTGDGRAVLFCVRDAGRTDLYRVDLSGGPARRVLGEAGHVVSEAALAPDGTLVAVRSTPTSFGDLVRVEPDGGTRTLYSGARPLLPYRERVFTVADGTTVHGWLLRAPGASGPQPLLLDIHGGPHNAWSGSADPARLYHQVLAARGWSVLVLNTRGSDGYGEAFYTATYGAWGEADARDFLDPLDELVRDGLADPARLAVTGYSYGGYMTCYLTAHDDRFAAAVAGAPVSDVTAMVGTADLGHHIGVRELAAEPWAAPERYVAQSPLTRVGEVRTPTLLLQGVADLRCPIGQSQQWFAALRERRVPTRLVLYPGAAHEFLLTGRPSHRADYNRRVIDWVTREEH
ncbi:S9 family peptidase [Microtetraspora fusca]|uniref:S9 family peptidase n=1 Tax=Microtetraspora fusca TaxID=1997 RepID=A0ABW6UX83_MICFU